LAFYWLLSKQSSSLFSQPKKHISFLKMFAKK
jgi:hypothetical protein